MADRQGDEDRLQPFHSTSSESIGPRAQPGYYPGFSTMAQSKYWDEATRRVVSERVESVPVICFFTQEESLLLSAISDRMLPQDDRSDNRRIPIVPWIDQRLSRNELSGFRYEDMPPDQQAYQWGLQAITAMAQSRFGHSFAQCSVHDQELLLKSIHDGRPEPPHALWQSMNVHRWWALVMEDIVSVYYAHPWAWDEIGFGGPAYPRGYMRLENGEPEPWEVDEKRYEWLPPADSVSGHSGSVEQRDETGPSSTGNGADR